MYLEKLLSARFCKVSFDLASVIIEEEYQEDAATEDPES